MELMQKGAVFTALLKTAIYMDGDVNTEDPDLITTAVAMTVKALAPTALCKPDMI